MRALSQGAPRRARARAAGRARAHGGARRSGAAAGASRLIGAIVAGGASSRFRGEPKGLHRVGDVRMIDRVAGALGTVTAKLMLVANAPDAVSWLPGVRVVGDVRPERGSLVGIHAALAAANDDVLVAAWDMPFVDAALLRALIARAADATAVVPIGPNGPEPFCAVYARAALPFIEEQLDGAELRLSALLARLPDLVTLPLAEVERFGDPRRLFFNVNTAADLAAAERMARGG